MQRLITITLLALAFCTATAEAADSLDFDRDVAPVLARRCLDCHSGADPKAKLDLSRRDRAMAGSEDGKVIRPGHAVDSIFWKVVDANEMPPKRPLPAEERLVLKRWIDGGAKWGTDPIDMMARSTDRRAGTDWWSLQPVKKTALPATKRRDWARNPIDAFVLAKLEAAGLSPSREADRRLLLRRVTLDLIGLPPTPEEFDAFLSDASADAYEKVVDRLLASPQYGVRWARHWLDVARFGESNGFEYDEYRPDAWRYRDWVVDALNRDLPYDEFAKHQIAGDVLHPTDASAMAATGFLAAGPYDTPGQNQQSAAMKAFVRQDELEDLIGTTGQVFLGLSLQCARCHDHKFDPIRQEEYYRVAAAFAGVRQGVRELPAAASTADGARKRLTEHEAALAAIEGPVRSRLKARRAAPPEEPLTPTYAWDFRQGLSPVAGNLQMKLSGNSELTREGLKLDGKTAFATSGPLPRTLKAKTLEAWVRLDNLDQRGGGLITVQTADGAAFDSVVFAERDPQQWMAGSEFFRRTQPFAGPAESDASRRFIHIAMTWGVDGTITAYRDGERYGQPYKAMSPSTVQPGSQVVIGLRHSPAGSKKHLAGVVQRAALYERVLTPAEIAASARAVSGYISDADIDAELTAEQRSRRAELLSAIAKDGLLLAGVSGKAYVVTPRAPEKTFLLARGNPASPLAEVTPGGVAAIAGTKADFGMTGDTSEPQRRTALANWIASPNNPLFARTIVNRLWHLHFGAGLVTTPNDLGFNGGRPSHPELLDFLASTLLEQKFSLKAMHRLIVTSATYRQASDHNAQAAAMDADNRLLWRRSPTRLEAEGVRDSALLLAGELDLSLGGPSFREPAPPGRFSQVGRHTPPPAEAKPFVRRTLYRAWTRGNRNGLLDALDCPDPSATAPARAITNTPVQALALLNNAAMVRAAEGFAKRVQSNAPEIDAQVKLAYRLAYGRQPDADELAVAKKTVESHGLLTLTRAILNSNEFLFVE